MVQPKITASNAKLAAKRTARCYRYLISALFRKQLTPPATLRCLCEVYVKEATLCGLKYVMFLCKENIENSHVKTKIKIKTHFDWYPNKTTTFCSL